jgi:hypothetical protein
MRTVPTLSSSTMGLKCRVPPNENMFKMLAYYG